MSCQATSESCQFNIPYLCVIDKEILYHPDASNCPSKLCFPKFNTEGKPTTLRCATQEEALAFQIGSKAAATMIRDGNLSSNAFNDKLNFT